MRIRKNRKLSSFMPAEMIQAYDCQFNQSPWDVISLSEETETDKKFIQHFERENNSKEDKSLGNFIGRNIGSDASLIEKPEKAIINVENISLENRDNNMDGQPELKEIEKIMGYIKNDGKGWQCKNEPKPVLSDHHFGSLQSHNVTNKSCEMMETTTTTISARPRRSRTMKKGSTSTANTHEFYYYSGFGPFWGKKKGEIEDIAGNNNNGVNCTQIDREELICIDGDEVDENEKSSYTDKAEVEINDNENENSCKKRKKSAIVSIYNVKGS